MTSGALSILYSLISNFLFSICVLQVGFADLCNLWCGARSVALEAARYEWLRAEVTGCDNFCLADKHRQNRCCFLFSITMNTLLGANVLLCVLTLYEALSFLFTTTQQQSDVFHSAVEHLCLKDAEMQIKKEQHEENASSP